MCGTDDLNWLDLHLLVLTSSYLLNVLLTLFIFRTQTHTSTWKKKHQVVCFLCQPPSIFPWVALCCALWPSLGRPPALIRESLMSSSPSRFTSTRRRRVIETHTDMGNTEAGTSPRARSQSLGDEWRPGEGEGGWVVVAGEGWGVNVQGWGREEVSEGTNWEAASCRRERERAC